MKSIISVLSFMLVITTVLSKNHGSDCDPYKNNPCEPDSKNLVCVIGDSSNKNGKKTGNCECKPDYRLDGKKECVKRLTFDAPCNATLECKDTLVCLRSGKCGCSGGQIQSGNKCETCNSTILDVINNVTNINDHVVQTGLGFRDFVFHEGKYIVLETNTQFQQIVAFYQNWTSTGPAIFNYNGILPFFIKKIEEHFYVTTGAYIEKLSLDFTTVKRFIATTFANGYRGFTYDPSSQQILVANFNGKRIDTFNLDLELVAEPIETPLEVYSIVPYNGKYYASVRDGTIYVIENRAIIQTLETPCPNQFLSELYIDKCGLIAVPCTVGFKIAFMYTDGTQLTTNLPGLSNSPTQIDYDQDGRLIIFTFNNIYRI